MGHWRWCTWIGFTHLLILAGGTPDFQQPYIAAPDTAHVDRCVTLSCYSNYKYPFVKASINWRRNGLPLHKSSEYHITQSHDYWYIRALYGYIGIYRSTLTVSDVNTAKRDNFTCQVVIGPRAVSGWSEVYVLVKQSGTYENYTVVREGHSYLITLKMPLDDYFKVMAPGNKRLFIVNTYYVDSDWVFIWNSYRTTVNITKITTSADAVIIQFSLHNATSEDAGRYHCSTWSDGPIPNCQHMLYVQGKPAHSYISVVVNTTNIVLTCETNSSIVPVDHDLRMIYTWKRNGQEFKLGGRFHVSGHTLSVTDVKKEDLGNYSCQSTEEGLASNWSDTVDLHMLANPPETRLPLVVGSSVAAVIVTLGIIAGLILSRLNRLRDYWHLRFRSYITPMQNMPEHIDDGEYAEIDDGEYAEIDDADLHGLGAGNIVLPAVNVPDDNNIPPACGGRHRRERQQMECEDDDYEEVRPLKATNREDHMSEQERGAGMHQSDKNTKEDIEDEMIMALRGSRTDSEPGIAVVGWSAEGREYGNMAAAIIDQFPETSFMTQEPDKTDTDKLPTVSGMYSGIDGITAIKAEEDDPLEEGREYYVESEPLDLPCNRYESLMPHQPRDTYTALDNDDDITHD